MECSCDSRTQRELLQAILTSLESGGGGGTGNLSGHGSPEGVVTADPGIIYVDIDAPAIYIKQTGTGNTGWV